MAPEALEGTIDHRVDIYAMGIILYEIFAGEVPFHAESFAATASLQLTQHPPLPSVVARRNHRVLPDGIEAVIIRCLEKDPAMRYQSMEQLADAIAACAGIAS